jgi:tetratricopeptide (TPR) repeat protein
VRSDIKSVDSRTALARVTLIAAIAAVLLLSWFGVRWQLGNMFAELTPVTQPDARPVAEFALGMAPGDPTARWLMAAKERENFDVESLERAVAMMEEVVRLSPYDFRWWIELGRAYEQAERPVEAEKALLRATEVAPEYTFPRWQLGNFYLRQNRTDEAFAELMKTTEKSGVYREQVFSLAWDYFDKDPQRVESLAGDAPDIRASLAMFFAVRGSAEDALRNWNMLPEDQKALNAQLPKVMAQGVYDQRAFRQAVAFAREAGMDPDAEPEKVTNAGFESFIGSQGEGLFGWRIGRGDSTIDIMPDSGVKRSGGRSLRVSFKGYQKLELFNPTQIVAVQPNTAYRLMFWVRTENLRSGGPPYIRVSNANDDTSIAASQPIEAATADWEMRTIEFTTPKNCEGIWIAVARGYCGDVCPINGTIWLDDFELARR